MNKIALMKKTAIIMSVILLFVLFAFLFVTAFNILLLLFGGILFSIFFHALSNKIRRWTHWPQWLTLILSFLLVIGFGSAVSYFVGNTVIQQYEEFEETIPKTIDNFKTYIKDTQWGEQLIESTPNPDENGDQIMNQMGKIFKSTFGFFGDLYALIFLGIFIMITPKEYSKGMLCLFPERKKKRVEEIIRKICHDLKIWLKAQMFEMLFVFVLTAIGLLALGINLWLILAIIAGTLTFIPNIGPALALIPAALVGLLESPEMALLIIGLFLLVQTIESGVFGPFVRKKMLSLPPALVLFFQLLMGSISGAWGILFATPILVMIIILINEIYIVDILGQESIKEK